MYINVNAGWLLHINASEGAAPPVAYVLTGLQNISIMIQNKDIEIST